MAGFMDLFKSASSEPAPAVPATPATPPVENNAGTQSPNTPPNKMAGSDQTPPNPLDAYDKMFSTSGNEEAPPEFTLAPEILDKVSEGLDFSKAVPAEIMQKAQAGDMQAMFQAMNIMNQAAYKTGLQHTSKLTDKFVTARSAHDSKSVKSSVRNELTAGALSATPNYNHPVVKNQLNMIATSLQRTNPDASPQEIAKMAQDYLLDVAKAITPGASQAEQTAAAASGEVDWTKYLEQGS